MTNSRTSNISKTYAEVKALFAEIASVANGATYENIPVSEAIARISNMLETIDGVIDRSLSQAEETHAEGTVTTVVTPLDAHWYTGDKW